MNLGAMTPSDISISPLASLGQAVCSSCLLGTVCLPGREHASQGDTCPLHLKAFVSCHTITKLSFWFMCQSRGSFNDVTRLSLRDQVRPVP